MIRGRFEDGPMITQNDNNNSVGKFGYNNTNTNLNQTNSIIRVNNLKKI